MKKRKGQALVEFALVSLVLVIILTAVLSLGLMFLQGATAQGIAANAREFLSGKITADNNTEEQIYAALAPYYDERYLVLDRDDYYNLELPRINSWMKPLYQYDHDLNVFRYPGTVVKHDDVRTVLIPQVSRTAGSETITAWLRPVEVGNIDSTSFEVTINFPAQAAAMIEYTSSPIDRDSRDPVLANDATVNVQASLPGGYGFASNSTTTEDNPFTATLYSDLNAGTYGLGEFHNFRTKVRPYRVILNGKATVRFQQ